MRIPPFYATYCAVVLALFAYSKHEGLIPPWSGAGGSAGSSGSSGFHYVGTSSGGSHK